MSSEIFILMFWYLIIPSSILGYGIFFQRLVSRDLVNVNIGYLGLLGIFFLISYSYLSNLLIPHTKIHNLFFVLGGLLFFLKNISLNQIKKKQFLILYSILIFYFISILIFKNHDDFEYYHFPYTFLLTQHDLIIGIGNFGHGFRTQSSIFYLNSLFYLPFIDYYLFNLGAVLILVFTNCILLDYIFKEFKDKKFDTTRSFLEFLSLCSFIFINVFFYRISEHGTDKSSQILILLLFIEVLYFLNFHKLSKTGLFKIFLIMGLVVSFKAFYLLYLSIFLILFLHVIKYEKKIIKSINFFIINKFFLFFSSLVFLILGTNLLNTGCIVYPVYFTCFENLSWSIPTEQVIQMNNWYELWSKAGATPNYRVSNPEEYIVSLNWVSNWTQNYFFTKVSDLIIGLIFLSVLIFFLFKSKKKKTFEKVKYLKLVLALIFLLFIEWFLNHPALRYGGYALIALIFFITLSLKLSNKLIDNNNFIKRALILIFISIFIFTLRNSIRINNENEKYNYNPFENAFYEINKKHLRIEKKLLNIIEKNEVCKKSSDIEICLDDVNKISEKFGKKIIENN